MNRTHPIVLGRLWALPATLLGLAAAGLAAATGGRVARRDGLIEVHGGFVARLLARGVPIARGAAAMTLGHVVLAQDEECLAFSRRHERVHVRQYERWGPFFLPAYVLASVAAALRGGHYYLDNAFERAAFREAPVRRPSCARGPAMRPPAPGMHHEAPATCQEAPVPRPHQTQSAADIRKI